MNQSITSMLQQLASEGVDPVSVEALSRLAGCDVGRLERSIKRLRLGDPLPYITRSVQAMGREFFVDRRVYRPSAGTEHLLRYALEKIPAQAHVLDVGTGSGWMAVTLKLERPHATVVGCDIDPDALEVARINALRHGVSIDLVESDLVASPDLKAPDYLLANLPYGEPAASEAQSSINKHMPHIALYHPAGPFAAFRELIASLRARRFTPDVFVESGSLSERVVAEAVPADVDWQQLRLSPKVSIVHAKLKT